MTPYVGKRYIKGQKCAHRNCFDHKDQYCQNGFNFSNYTLNICLSLWLLFSLQFTSCTPVKDGKKSAKLTPSQWLKEIKPAPRPNDEHYNRVNDYVHEERQPSPRRASVAEHDLPRYDLAKQKAQTYGRLHEAAAFGINSGTIDRNDKKKMNSYNEGFRDSATHYHNKAERILQQNQPQH